MEVSNGNGALHERGKGILNVSDRIEAQLRTAGAASPDEASPHFGPGRGDKRFDTADFATMMAVDSFCAADEEDPFAAQAAPQQDGHRWRSENSGVKDTEQWLENELKAQIEQLHQKMDMLTQKVSICVNSMRILEPVATERKYMRQLSTTLRRSHSVLNAPKTPRERGVSPQRDLSPGSSPRPSPRTDRRSQTADEFVIQESESFAMRPKASLRSSGTRHGTWPTAPGQPLGRPRAPSAPDIRFGSQIGNQVSSKSSTSIGMRRSLTQPYPSSGQTSNTSGEPAKVQEEEAQDTSWRVLLRSKTFGTKTLSSTSLSVAGSVGAIKHEMQKLAGRTRTRRRCTKKLWELLTDRESSRMARWYSQVMPAFIFLSVVYTLGSTIDEADRIFNRSITGAVETAVELAFGVDLVMRWFSCPNRLSFVLNLYNIADIVSVAPLALRASVGFVITAEMEGENTIMFVLAVLPVLRLVKTLRYFPNVILLMNAFKLAFETLPALLYTLALIALTFASAIYMVEERSNVPSLPKAIWLTIVTMTTVGYGDMVPESFWGIVIVACLVVSSVLYMSIPLGLIGHAFQVVWADRHKILLVQRARDSLIQWGYTADNVREFFEHFDADGSGEIDIEEFEDMIKAMKIGLSKLQIQQLFKSFAGPDGDICEKDFIAGLFPNQYAKLYDIHEGGEEDEDEDSEDGDEKANEEGGHEDRPSGRFSSMLWGGRPSKGPSMHKETADVEMPPKLEEEPPPPPEDGRKVQEPPGPPPGDDDRKVRFRPSVTSLAGAAPQPHASGEPVSQEDGDQRGRDIGRKSTLDSEGFSGLPGALSSSELR